MDCGASASSVSDMAGTWFHLVHYDHGISGQPLFAAANNWPTPARAKEAWSNHVEIPANTGMKDKCHVTDGR